MEPNLAGQRKERLGRRSELSQVTRTGACLADDGDGKQQLQVWRSKGLAESGPTYSALDNRTEGKAMTLLFTGVRRALCVLAAMTIVLTGFSWVLTAPPSQAANPIASPNISAPPDVVVGETDGSVDLPVTLNAPGESTVTVNYTTADGTASGAYASCAYANSAYVHQSGTLTFTPGETTQVVQITLLNCQHSLSTGFLTFSFNLSGNSTGSSIVSPTTEVNITGDVAASTTPALYVLNAEVDASAGSVNVPVVLGGPSGAAQGVPVTVDYTTNDGSALAGTDYTTTSGTLTFPPGETAQNISVPILDRSGAAATRSFSVTLSTPTNATVADAVGVVTIGASGAPAVSLPEISAPPNVVVGETDGYVDLPVTLNAPGESTVTVNYSTADGTASGAYASCAYANSAYVHQSGTLTFTPGETTQVVQITLLNCQHSLSTGFLTFSFNLSGNSTGSSIVSPTTEVNITGDVAASTTPALYVLNAEVDASAGSVNVPVVLGGPSGAAEGVPVTVDYTTNDGSALAGTDYTTTSGTLTFPPGETAQNISVPILDRSGAAATRSFSVTLSTPTNATVADAVGVVTIGASGAPAVSLPEISAPPNVVVGETDGYVDLPVTLNAPGESTVTVNYSTADGTASGAYASCAYANSAYVHQSGTLTFTPGETTQVVQITLLNCQHSLSTGFLTFSFNLSGNSTGSSIVSPTTEVNITGDVAASTTPALYVLNAEVDASAGSVNVPVVLGGPSGAAEGVPVTVDYTTNDGSALAGTDYTTTSGTLTFPPGETAQNISVPILDRSGAAATRSFSVTLSTPTNATVADAVGVVTIGASGAPAVSLPEISAPPNVVVGETDGYVDLPVTLNAPGESTVTVNYSTADGTASGAYASCAYANSAYVHQSGTLTFTPGETTQVVQITLLNCQHSLSTGFLTFSFNLSGNSTGSSIVSPTTEVNITGDVAASTTPALYVLNAEVDASAGSVNVPVVLGGPSGAAEGVPVTVDYTTNDGSALAGTDYTTTSGTLTFPPGETAQNISVPILDRSGAAATRSFSVTLSTPTNATVADAVGVVTIGASGAPAVSLPEISAPPNVVVGETDGYVDLPVTLNAPGESTVTVNYSTADGTASGAYASSAYANSAYVHQSGTLTFTPGETTQVVQITLLNCPINPASLTFTFGLTNPVKATIVSTDTTVTIVATPGVPGAPTSVAAVPGNQRAVISFAAPGSDGGDPVNSYTVTASPGGETASGVSSPITVTGLTNGTSYTFTVAATNDVGTGSSSAASNAVTPAVILITPTTPTISNLPASGAVGGGFTATVSTTGDGTKSVTSNATSVCTVSGFAVTYVSVGTCSLTAHVAAGSNYAAASGTAQTFAITAAPAPYSPLAPVRICDTRATSVSGLTGAAAQCNGNTIAAGTVRTMAAGQRERRFGVVRSPSNRHGRDA